MEEKKVLERLQRQCSKAEYCSSDVRRKALKAMEGDSEAASRIVEALVRERFVDDGRYAAAFSREKSSLQGWGAVKIRFMLRSKGIPDEIISAALEEIDPGKAERKLDKLVSDKARLLEGDPQKRLKLLKFALGRGYSYDEVEKAIDRLAQPRG
ncbi:MAG: RecX family transcriptional regulator [Bacteroidales bacterium]|nr:RecX family transcriptional regulator [Bacteroidales bacterium]MBQ4299303.1 RecX family transcriptional regulator [Bacteroidales bacterium]